MLIASMLVGLALFLAGFVSTLVFLDYVADEEGEISVSFASGMCTAMAMVLLLILLGVNLRALSTILRTSEEVRAQRAAYFQLLFPLLLAGFMLSTPAANFAPSFAFGFPLLLMGAVLYPYSALVLSSEVRAMENRNLVRVRCHRCAYMFEMHREEEWVRCPYCGEPNMNPARAPPPGPAMPPGEGARPPTH